MLINEWLARWWHTLPPEAQAEFADVVTPHSNVVREVDERSESAIQADIRLAASKDFGGPLWRNNSGAAQMIDPHNPEAPARHVRFGLGNDSARVNGHWKSSDLIGITPMLIEQRHVGRTVGVFTAIEVKAPDWHLIPSDKRANAQNTFMTAAQTFGGIAGFAQSIADYVRIITGFKK